MTAPEKLGEDCDEGHVIGSSYYFFFLLIVDFENRSHDNCSWIFVVFRTCLYLLQSL